MGKSTDPKAYAPTYHKLAELMDRGVSPITLRFGKQLANYHRSNFYGFINAWKKTAEKTARDKTLEPGERDRRLELALRREESMRGYIAIVSEEQDLEGKVELVFMKRGMDERQISALDQLNNLEATLPRETGQNFEEFTKQLNKAPAPISNKVIESNIKAADSPISHLFSGIKTIPDKDLESDEAAMAEIHREPEDRTDITSLLNQAEVTEDLSKKQTKKTSPITNSNPPASSPPTSEEILKLAKSARKYEKGNKP